jgi:hypothetical protein
MKKIFKTIYDLAEIINTANRAAWLTRRGQAKQAIELYQEVHP